MGQPPKLTTTSYVILGHLALRDWSTYELAQQMKRSTRHFWPRAQSKIYEEPKKLVAHGLATATREYAGRRPRTIYAITAKGRRALRAWLDEPTQLPLVEFDAAVKVQFAEQGTKAQLLATLRSVREQAERTREEHVALAADLVTPETRFSPPAGTSTSSS
jgi:PadR family transcriptional regulator AphA